MTDDDIRASLQQFITPGWEAVDDGERVVIRMTQDAVETIVTLCHGDPYLFQLAGRCAWDDQTAPTITREDAEGGWRAARDEARRHVERLLERLPALEYAFVEAMAALPSDDRTLTRIAEELEYDRASQLGPTAQRLDTIRGVIERRGARAPYRFRARAVEALLSTDWP